MPTAAQAQDGHRGGTLRIQRELPALKETRTWDWSEIANQCRGCLEYGRDGQHRYVFDKMRHPYTQALFRSIPLPSADMNANPLVAICGNFPLPHERPLGCNFGPRCDYFQAVRCGAHES